MFQLLSSKRPKSCATNDKNKRSFRLFSSFFNADKVSRSAAEVSESPSSLSDKLGASPVTPSERSATLGLHIVTPSTHQTLANALEQLSERRLGKSKRDASVSQRRLFFTSAMKSRQKECAQDSFSTEREPRTQIKPSYAKLRAQSDLLSVENDELRKRLSQLEMAEVERNCLQTRICELEWALDVLRDDADRIRDDALAVIGQDFRHGFDDRVKSDVHAHQLDYLVDEDIEDLRSDDILFDNFHR